jgi:hypothetical protein
MDNSAISRDLDLFELQARRFSLIPLNGKRPFEQGWEKWCETRRGLIVGTLKGTTQWHYFFPALENCRKAFQQLVNIELQWS